MNKRLLLCLCLSFSATQTFAQRAHSSPREIELNRIENIRNGKSPDEGILTVLTFSFEDYSLFEKNFSAIQNDLLQQNFKSEIQSLPNSKKCEVVYPLVYAKTDDYLKIFKETIFKYGVLLSEYKEDLSIKSN